MFSYSLQVICSFARLKTTRFLQTDPFEAGTFYPCLKRVGTQAKRARNTVCTRKAAQTMYPSVRVVILNADGEVIRVQNNDLGKPLCFDCDYGRVSLGCCVREGCPGKPGLASAPAVLPSDAISPDNSPPSSTDTLP